MSQSSPICLKAQQFLGILRSRTPPLGHPDEVSQGAGKSSQVAAPGPLFGAEKWDGFSFPRIQQIEWWLMVVNGG
jgi:hypothetical protein